MAKVCLIIVDGFGISKNGIGDATDGCEFIKTLKDFEIVTEMHASGKWVGVIDGMSGNSEVGHFTIGSGRINKQNIVKINEMYESGEFNSLINSLPKLSRRIHLIGLLSNGSVHSHASHVQYLIDSLSKNHDIFIHAISDGIDTPQKNFGQFLKHYQKDIVSISGRYFAMDRNKNYNRTQKAFNVMTRGKVEEFDLEKIYSEGIPDELIEPVLIKNERILPEDTVIFFNLRADRMRQLYALMKEYCTAYTMVEYELNDPNSIIKTENIENTLARWLEVNGKTQAHIAETEKYAHVTYFLNGGKEVCQKNEKWIVVESPKVENFSLTPGTSMSHCIDKAEECINCGVDFIVVNLAAPDLVGHTGDLIKTREACKIMDDQVKRIYKKCYSSNYAMVLTADHGNSECMIKNDEICKSHTDNMVPFVVANTKMKIIERKDYSLQDVAPTVLTIMGISKPDGMTGCSVIQK